MIEELPTRVRAELLAAETASQEEPTARVTGEMSPAERILYGLLGTDEARPIDDLVELSSLGSSEVLASLFDLEMKGVVRQLPGKQFPKVLL